MRLKQKTKPDCFLPETAPVLPMVIVWYCNLLLNVAELQYQTRPMMELFLEECSRVFLISYNPFKKKVRMNGKTGKPIMGANTNPLP